MQPGQWITRLRVIEFRRHVFPVDKVVALQAVLSQPAIMEIFVASHAGLRDAEEGFAQILHLDRGALGSRNFFGEVALVASQARVLALEQVSGFLVVELVWIPLDQGEIHSIVVGVTTHAFLAGSGGDVIGSVQSALGCDASADVAVAADATKLGLATAELVAFRAMNGAV